MGKHYQQLFALIKNPKYVKMRLPKNGRPSELNNTANAGRIVRSRNGRKILPAFFATVFVAALAIAAIPQERESAAEFSGAGQVSHRRHHRWQGARPMRYRTDRGKSKKRQVSGRTAKR